MESPAPLTVTATYNQRSIRALAAAVSADPARVYLVEPEGDGAAIVERSVPSFVEVSRRSGVSHERIQAFAVSPDGRRAAVVTAEPAGLVIEGVALDGGAGWGALLDLDGVEGLRWSSDGARVFVGSAGDVRVFDGAGGALVERLAIPGVEALSSDGSCHARWTAEGAERWLALVDTASRQTLARWPADTTAGAMDRVVVSPSGDGVWWLQDTPSKTTVRWCAPGGGGGTVSVPNSLRLFIAEAAGAVLRTDEGRLGRVIRGADGAVSVSWPDAPRALVGAYGYGRMPAPHNRRFAVVGWPVVLALLDLDDGRELHAPDGHAGEVEHLVASPDGARVAAFWLFGEVAVLDAATLAAEMTFELGERAVAAAFAPDGRELHVLTREALLSLRVRDGSVRRTPLAIDPPGWGQKAFAVAPDGAEAIVRCTARDESLGSETHSLVRVDLATGRVTAVPVDPTLALSHPRYAGAPPSLRAVVNDGAQRLVAVDPESGRAETLRTLDPSLPADEENAWRGLRPEVHLSPSGTLLVAEYLGRSGMLAFVVADDGSPARSAAVPFGEVVALDDHRHARAEDRDDVQGVTVYDLATLRPLGRLSLADVHRVNCACLAAGGGLVVGLADGRVRRAALA